MSQKEPAVRPPSMLPLQSFNVRLRIRTGLILSVLGLFIFILGADPGLFGLDRSPVTGFVQIAVFLVGLALISLGGYLALVTLWRRTELPISADIGRRLISTGYLVAVASGMADVFGFGSEALPRIPEFGVWQQRGVFTGEILIAVGFLMLIPWSSTAVQGPDEAKPTEQAGEEES
jgi:hypothetical protein